MRPWSSESLDAERLLKSWRWLCPQALTILDRNAFGDLVLQDNSERVYFLDAGVGMFTEIANSQAEYRQLASLSEKQEDWFACSDEQNAAKNGMVPGPGQCIGFSIPVVFEEGSDPYIADIYDYVGCLGDIHRQIASLPDGAKVQLVVKKS